MQHRLTGAGRALLASSALAALAVGAPGGGAARAESPYVRSGTVDDIEIDRLVSFGDSYSRLNRKTRFRNFVEQMRDEGDASAIQGFGVSGATAANVEVNGSRKSFRQQLNRWRNAGPVFGDRHATVVYFGYNDIDKFTDLARSRRDYSSGISTLVNNGATLDDRHVFLFQVHDWGKNPGQASNPTCDPGGTKTCRQQLRERTQSWNSHVAAVANSRERTIAVDLFTAFDRITADPGRYGLMNVTTADSRRSSTTALFDDDNHFGGKGQDLVQQVFQHYLTRAWDWSHALAAGAQASQQLNQDIIDGIVFNLAALAAQQRLGLGAFAIGELAGEPVEPPEEGAVDVTRAGFAQVYHPDERPDGGVALNYAVSEDTALGVVIGRYAESVEAEHELASSSSTITSDAVAVYLSHKMGGLDLLSRLVVGDDRHEKSDHDELIDETSRAEFGGRTTELAQRAGYPFSLAGAVWTPWVELARRVQEVDSFTMSNPYVSDVTYSAAKAAETLAGIGIDAASEPMPVGEDASFRLRGGLSYTQSLSRDDYRVTVSEASGPNRTQEERVERPQLRQIGLSLGGEFAVGERLAVGAGLTVTEDLDRGRDQELSLRFSYRF